jgi:hypothetical protein
MAGQVFDLREMQVALPGGSPLSDFQAMRAALPSARVRKNIGVCAYCGGVRRLTVDHVMPKSRFPRCSLRTRVCGWCNASKADLTPEEWLACLPWGAPQHQFVPGAIAAAWAASR